MKNERIKESGITLIALIITIIVMLILVGVTVGVALNGGLFRTAQVSAQETDRARIEEEMTSVVLGFMNENLLVDVNIEDLKAELLKIKGIISVDGNSFPLTVKDENGNEWTINQDGTIKLKEPEVKKVISADDPEASYWKTDGNGTIIYYEPPEGVEVPEALIVPCQIGDEVITKVGDWALTGYKVELDEEGLIILEDGQPIFCYDEEGNIKSKRSEIKNVTISKGIQEIGFGTFYGCTSLITAKIPSTVTTMEGGAFWECESLATVNIPSEIKEIGENLFADCISLRTIVIPEGVKTIGMSAFRNCISISEINIPSAVENMGSYTFEGWTNSQTIYIKGKTEAPPDSDNDSYSKIGWNFNWDQDCNANIVWDK